MIENRFSQLDAQTAESAFAKFTPEEHAEMQDWIDAQKAMPPEAVDHTPDPLHDDLAY